jgi:hypothetical protein
MNESVRKRRFFITIISLKVVKGTKNQRMITLL